MVEEKKYRANPRALYRETASFLPKALKGLWPIFLISAVFAAAVGFSGYMPVLLLVTVPFILLPFYASLTIGVSLISQGRAADGRTLGKGLLAYFRPPFFGSYGITRTFVYGALLLLLLGPVITLIAALTAENWNPALMEEIDALLSSLGSTGSLGVSIEELLTEYPQLMLFENAVLASELGIVFLLYVHRQNRAAIIPHIAIHLSNPSLARTIFERTFHGPYGLRKDYYAGALPGYVAPALGYVIGVLIAAFTPLGQLWMSAFGLMLGLLFHVLSLIWHLSFVERLFAKYEPLFREETILLFRQSADRYEAMGEMGREYAERIRESLREEEEKGSEGEAPAPGKEEEASEGKGRPSLDDYGRRDGSD